MGKEGEENSSHKNKNTKFISGGKKCKQNLQNSIE